MRLSTPRTATSLSWIHATLSFGRREYWTWSQPGGPWLLTRNASGTFSIVGFVIVSNDSVAPGASNSATSGTIASAASNACTGGGTVVVVLAVVVVGAAAAATVCADRGHAAATTAAAIAVAIAPASSRRERIASTIRQKGSAKGSDESGTPSPT